MYNEKKLGVVIPASGSGSRMNSKEKKQFLKIDDKEILQITIESIIKLDSIDELVVVCNESDIERTQLIMKKAVLNSENKRVKMKAAIGGKTRQSSVFNGLNSLSEKIELVLIHDGARPFIDTCLMRNVLENLGENDSVSLAVKSIDSIKKVENGFVVEDLDRNKLWNIQTPQAFKVNILKKAHVRANEKNILTTDDCSLCQLIDVKTKIVEGSYENIKITKPIDLIIGEKIYKERKDNENRNRL